MKDVSDHNPIFIPTNLMIFHGTAISFLDADVPWDTPHSHTIDIMNSLTGKVAYTTGKLDYTNATNPKVLPEGNYTIVDTKYKWMHGNLTTTTRVTYYNAIRGL
ncbi:MAG: hypothetical protein WA395_00600 [Nitrososphaeraceae archaeon]